MPLPPLTPEQRAASLEKAALARKERVALKEKLKTGALTLQQVLKDGEPSGTIANMRVSELLHAVPGVGRLKAQQAMQEHGIAESRRVRGLGVRQRAALVEHFTK